MRKALIVLGGCLLILCTLRPAVAGVHEVWDEAHFFSAPAIGQVDSILQDIQTRYGKDLMIETFASIPDDLKPNLQRDGKEKFFQEWATSEGSQLKINGVMILITGQPAHVQVAVGLETRKKAFTLSDRDELVAQLAGAFRQKDFDGGITRAAEFVRDRMARNMAGAATQPSTQPTTSDSTQPAGH